MTLSSRAAYRWGKAVGYSMGYAQATMAFWRSALYLASKLKAGDNPSVDEVMRAGEK